MCLHGESDMADYLVGLQSVRATVEDAPVARVEFSVLLSTLARDRRWHWRWESIGDKSRGGRPARQGMHIRIEQCRVA